MHVHIMCTNTYETSGTTPVKCQQVYWTVPWIS